MLIWAPTEYTSVNAVLAVRVWPCFLLVNFFSSAVAAEEFSCCLRSWVQRAGLGGRPGAVGEKARNAGALPAASSALAPSGVP